MSLGDIEAAECVYEQVLPLLSVDDMHVQLTKAVMLAERAFFLEQFEESKSLIAPLIERPLKNRTKLTLVYRLAQIAELEGDLEAARGLLYTSCRRCQQASNCRTFEKSNKF